ncbi:ROK family transcriptional regulator [Spirosoma luteolum]
MQDNPVLSVIDTKKSKLKRKLIAELYRSDSRTISQLAGILHTSVPSTTNLIDELSADGWVRGIGTGNAQFGRKPSLFALDPTRFVTIVADITIHDTKLVAFNLANQVVSRLDIELGLDHSANFLSILREPLEQLAQQLSPFSVQVIGTGISLPGLVDPRHNINHTYANLNGPGPSLGQLFQDVFGAPTYFINDTQATILGEHRFGLARGKSHVMSVNIDWGVGLGVIIGGEIFQGSAGFAGELGHIQMKTEGGELCHCGKVGCLDTLASASALIRKARLGLQEGAISVLSEENPDELTIETIITKASLGDAFSLDLLSDVGQELGRGLATAVHLFNPERIIVNGVLAKAEKAIIRPIEQAIAKYCLPNYRDNLTIEQSTLDGMAKLYGAQAYVLQNLLDQELIP